MKRQSYSIGVVSYIKLVAETPEENEVIRDLVLVLPWTECHCKADRVSIEHAFYGSIDFRSGIPK